MELNRMLTLSLNETSQVSGGCPVCLMTTTCAAIGASSVVMALSTRQVLLLAAGGILLTGALMYSVYHTNEAWLDLSPLGL